MFADSMKSKDLITNKIKEIARNYFSDEEIMLFESRASMTATSDSDYDVIIITSQLLQPE